MPCKCSLNGLKRNGVREAQDETLCNFCNKVVSQEMISKLEDSPKESSSESLANLTAMGSALLKPSNSDPEADGRDIKINEIIRRMWIWIITQAIFIGIWAGNAFPIVHDGYYSYSESFNFGMLVVGVLFGIGAFAPLVFVVEALREVILNIIKGPIAKKN